MAKAGMEATTARDTSSDSEQRVDNSRLQQIAREQAAAGALRAERRRERQRLESLAARVSALRAIQRRRDFRSR
jgi:hypothetical protein